MVADEKAVEPVAVPPIDLATLALRLDDRGRLFVVGGKTDGEDMQIMARRAFPWSRPGELVSLRTTDGNEVALVERLDAVSAESRGLIERSLASSTFVPRITRIDRVNMEHGYQQWHVHTDAGPAELRVQEREDVRFLSETRFSVKDATGNVYEIEDVGALDDKSRRELARVV